MVYHLPPGLKPVFYYSSGKGPDGLGQWGDAYPVHAHEGTKRYDPVLVHRSVEHSLFDDLLQHANVPITTGGGKLACRCFRDIRHLAVDP